MLKKTIVLVALCTVSILANAGSTEKRYKNWVVHTITNPITDKVQKYAEGIFSFDELSAYKNGVAMQCISPKTVSIILNSDFYMAPSNTFLTMKARVDKNAPFLFASKMGNNSTESSYIPEDGILEVLDEKHLILSDGEVRHIPKLVMQKEKLDSLIEEMKKGTVVHFENKSNLTGKENSFKASLLGFTKAYNEILKSCQ